MTASWDDAALAAWRTLTGGGWTIVDDIDAGGRRYLVARRDDRATALSVNERLVCAMAAHAHPQKVIAAELGLHPSAVVRCLARGMAKLGVRSLAGLARRFAWLPATATQNRGEENDHGESRAAFYIVQRHG